MGQSGDTSMGLRSDDDFKEIICVINIQIFLCKCFFVSML